MMYFSNLNLSCISFAFYAVCRKSGVHQSASEKDFRLKMFYRHIQYYFIVFHTHPFAPDFFCWIIITLGKKFPQWQKGYLKKGMKWNEQGLAWTHSQHASSAAYLGIKQSTLHLKKLLHRVYLLQSCQILGLRLPFPASDYGPGFSLLTLHLTEMYVLYIKKKSEIMHGISFLKLSIQKWAIGMILIYFPDL